MMTELTALVVSETTASDVITVVENWFDAAGGGFETNAYQGSDSYLSSFALSEHESATIEIKADDDAIRDVLKGLALASLVEKGTFEDNITQQAFLLQSAGEMLLSSETNLLDLQADVGIVQEQISDAQTSLVAEGYALDLATSDIMSVDLYETATNLTQAETQLEMIYTITARLSQLKLSDYI
jgi:flagellar hook-associated protein 3 FlgL